MRDKQMTYTIVNQSPTVAAPNEMYEDPYIYQVKNAWRYSWGGEDRGPFSSQQEATHAAAVFKGQSMARFFAAALRQS
jgi:hypothetical protein